MLQKDILRTNILAKLKPVKSQRIYNENENVLNTVMFKIRN